jgi:aldehyde dehydrogenase (NAD+)
MDTIYQTPKVRGFAFMKQNFIAGEWLDGASAADNINPSDTSDIIGQYAQADVAQTEQAIESAYKALPGWANSPIQQRSDMLDKIGNEILARKEELGELLSREEGKTLPEGIGEAVRAGQVFKFFGAEVLRQGGEIFDSVRPGLDVSITRSPVGVVGLILPWNFPIAIPAWKVAPALAYGNCVVFKPAALVPATAHAMSEIIVNAGVPEGVFNLVMGSGSKVGATIVNHPQVHAISFTGSVSTGRGVAAAAVERMAKVQLEMGGKNPLIVLDDADLATAVECAVNGAYFSTGQRCTASSRLIVTEGIHNKFVAAVKERLAGLSTDHALKAGTDIGPVVDQRQLQQDLDYIQVGVDEGANLICGGQQVSRDTEGFFLTPALFTETNNNMRINREEIFGPVASVICAKDYEEALAIANDTEFGLSAGIVTTSLKYASHFKRNIQSGIAAVNVPTAGVDYHVPFGGTKGSSYGAREQGQYAKEFYTTVKTAYTLA